MPLLTVNDCLAIVSLQAIIPRRRVCPFLIQSRIYGTRRSRKSSYGNRNTCSFKGAVVNTGVLTLTVLLP